MADAQKNTPQPASAPSATHEESSSHRPQITITNEEGAQVTITTETDLTVKEYRVGGRLYMIKVIPKHGKPYYLVDDRGDGKFSRQDSLDFGVRPPQWVIHQF